MSKKKSREMKPSEWMVIVAILLLIPSVMDYNLNSGIWWLGATSVIILLASTLFE